MTRPHEPRLPFKLALVAGEMAALAFEMGGAGGERPGMMIRLALAFVLLAAPALAEDGFQITGRATLVDADTIRVEGSPKDIRLFGIDAPERAQLCTETGGKRFLCGGRASEELAQILGRNPRVSCKLEDVDRHGRLVSTCWSAGVNLSAELVRRGWAVDYGKYSGGRYEAEEEAAREAKRGLWGLADFEMPWDWRARRRARPAKVGG